LFGLSGFRKILDFCEEFCSDVDMVCWRMMFREVVRQIGSAWMLGCQLLFSVSNIFLPIYSNFSNPAVFLSIPVIAAVICSQ